MQQLGREAVPHLPPLIQEAGWRTGREGKEMRCGTIHVIMLHPGERYIGLIRGFAVTCLGDGVNKKRAPGPR